MLQFLVIVSGPAMAIFVVDVMLRRYAYDGVELFDDHAGARFWYTGGWSIPGMAALLLGGLATALCLATSVWAGPIAQATGYIDLSVPVGMLVAGRALRSPAAHFPRQGRPAVTTLLPQRPRLHRRPEPPRGPRPFAIDGDTIAFVGDDDDAPERRDATVDLDGRLVLPGFTDAHTHLLMMGEALGQVDLTAARTLDEIQSSPRDGSRRRPRTPPCCADADGSSTRSPAARRRRR